MPYLIPADKKQSALEDVKKGMMQSEAARKHGLSRVWLNKIINKKTTKKKKEPSYTNVCPITGFTY